MIFFNCEIEFFIDIGILIGCVVIVDIFENDGVFCYCYNLKFDVGF